MDGLSRYLAQTYDNDGTKCKLLFVLYKLRYTFIKYQVTDDFHFEVRVPRGKTEFGIEVNTSLIKEVFVSGIFVKLRISVG